MKTPMQQHIEMLKEKYHTLREQGYRGVALDIAECIDHAESMLEKEKEAMKSVWLDGKNSRINGQDPIEQIKNL